MSEALEALKQDIGNIVDVIDLYQTELKDVKTHLRIEGKTIERANVEHASWLNFYGERCAELHAIVKYMRAQTESIHGSLWKGYTEGYTRALQQKDKEQYIIHDPQYLTVYNCLLEIEELYEKYAAVVEAFKARGYALNNITRLKVADATDYSV